MSCRGRLAGLGLFDKTAHAAIRVRLDDAELAWIVDRARVDRRHRVVLAVRRQQRAQVDAGEDIAVADEDRTVDVVDRVLDGARGAERLLFVDVMQADAVRPAVAEMRLDRLGQIAA